MGNIKDTDYLYTTGRVRVLERELLNRERLERMLEAKNTEDALKVLGDCGYQDFLKSSDSNLESALSAVRRHTFDAFSSFLPDARIVDLFKIKYDYHNIKTILKADATQVRADMLLSDTGRIAPDRLQSFIHEGTVGNIPDFLRKAIEQARSVLARTSDPQLADFELDRSMFEEYAALAKETGSRFIEGYVRLLTDSANLRTYVRAGRLHRGYDFLRLALIPGGNIPISRLLEDTDGEALTRIYRSSLLFTAAEAGLGAIRGGKKLSEIDRLCDNAVTAYLRSARQVPFGEQPVIAFLHAREAEQTAVRTVMAGRAALLSQDAIRERLRETYV